MSKSPFVALMATSMLAMSVVGLMKVVEFTVTVRNDGPADAAGVVATGILPPGELEFVDGPFGFNFDLASGGWLHAPSRGVRGENKSSSPW